MKTKTTILAFFSGFLLVGGVFILSYAWAESQSPDRARILGFEGAIQVKEAGSDVWRVPKKGAWVGLGAEIKSGPNSSCDIGFGEDRKSVVHLKPQTRTILQALNTDKMQVKLEEGSVYARIRNLNKESTFEIVSPTAVAVARGTGWEQSIEEINVFESAVEVQGAGGETTLVEEGFGLEIDITGDLKEVEELAVEEKAEWENFEAQAEKAVSEEASLPEDPGYQDTGSANSSESNSPSDSLGTPSDADGSSSADSGDSKGDGVNSEDEDKPEADLESPENSFDGFEDGFGSDQLEADSPGADDILGEAKEEQQESLSPLDFDSDDPKSNCYTQGGTNTSC